MSATQAAAAAGSDARHRIAAVLIVLLVLTFAAQILGAVRRIVDGDEFIFLEIVYRVENGLGVGLLQSPFAHLFAWLTRIESDEIAQITTARLIYVVVWAVSLALLYKLSRRLLDPLGALTGVVLYALFSFSIGNAAGFRIDGLLLPVLLSIALFLLNPTVAHVAAAGALSGIALALTIKAVLWAPAFIGVLAVGLRLRDGQDRLKPVVAGVLAGAATFAGIMLVHSWLISTPAAPMPGISGSQVATIGSYMFAERGFFPRLDVLADAIKANLVTWMLLLVGLCLTAADLRKPPARRNALLLLLLALPILSVAFYANAFPYAYVVLMPAACLLAGRALSRFMGTGNGLKGVTALACLAAAALPLTYSLWYYRIDWQEPQRQILSHVHDLFREPVPYIDRSGMVSSFPRRVFLMTQFGVMKYRERGAPELTHYIHSAHPPLLIANKPLLDVWQGDAENLDPNLRLLPQDEETIRATYAHYWGRIYLAGRQWRDVGAGASRSFEIVIPGDYTLVADNAVTVDGRTYAPGATLVLAAGQHGLRTTSAEPDLRLLWGRGTQIPLEEPVSVAAYYWE